MSDYGYNKDLKYRFVATNKSTNSQQILFEGKLQVFYCKKRNYYHVTCPYGYENKVHSYLDGTEIVFQWFETNEKGQEIEHSGPNWNKLQNNCFGRMIEKTFSCPCCKSNKENEVS
jgi:hypothetical protein